MIIRNRLVITHTFARLDESGLLDECTPEIFRRLLGNHHGIESKCMEEKSTNRVEAFSDGVFAVAITLLILNIKIPGLDLLPGQVPKDTVLWQELPDHLPSLVAYVTSFATIGIMWINHHRLFNHIKRTDTGLQLFNLLLLLIIVFIPVPTALLSEYITLPNDHVAAIIYSGTNIVLAICFNLLWRYASHHNRLLGKNVDTHAVAAINRQYAFGPLLYLLAFALAWFNTPASLALNFILALFFALPSRALRQLSSSNASAGLGEE